MAGEPEADGLKADDLAVDDHEADDLAADEIDERCRDSAREPTAYWSQRRRRWQKNG